MARHKSALKRSKQDKKKQLQNASIKSGVKTRIKKVIQAVEAKDKAGSAEALAGAIPVIDKAASKGVFHKKSASRKISKLTKKVNALQG